jgi:hypothetical protein
MRTDIHMEDGLKRPEFSPLSPARRLLAAFSLAGLLFAAAAVGPTAPAAAAITPSAGIPLTNVNSGKCLNVSQGSTADEAPVVQYTCYVTTLNDKWRAVPMGDGTYHIIAIHSGKCLNVDRGSSTNGAPVIQYFCTTSAKNDRWRPRPVPGTQKFQLVAEHSGKCLNVSGASLVDNAPIIQYTCTTAGKNDYWYFPPATATQPSVPIQQDTPISALQSSPASGATVGGLMYAYVDNIGRLLHGNQPNPANFGNVQWTVVSGLEAFSGQPGLAEQADGRMQVVAHNTDSDTWLRTQVSKTSTDWYNWADVAGSSPNHPTVGRMPDGKLVNFVVAADGKLWAQPQNGVNLPFLGWRYIGGANLVGTPVVATIRDGLQVFGLLNTGVVYTATYRNGALSDWTSLGGTGMQGPADVVVAPGYRIRVFVTGADGMVVTKQQDDAGVFPAAWDPIAGLVAAGPPSAVLDPASGAMQVVARDANGGVWATAETAAGSGTWRPWTYAIEEFGPPSATDPTAFTFNDGSTNLWAFVLRKTNGEHRIYYPGSTMAALTGGSGFTGHTMPAPPQAPTS